LVKLISSLVIKHKELDNSGVFAFAVTQLSDRFLTTFSGGNGLDASARSHCQSIVESRSASFSSSPLLDGSPGIAPTTMIVCLMDRSSILETIHQRGRK